MSCRGPGAVKPIHFSGSVKASPFLRQLSVAEDLEYIFNPKKKSFLRLSCRGSGAVKPIHFSGSVKASPFLRQLSVAEGLGQLNQYISRDLRKPVHFLGNSQLPRVWGG